MKRVFLAAVATAIAASACASGSTSDTGEDGSGAGIVTGVGGGSGGSMPGDGLPLGSPCMDDAECNSVLCEEAFLDLPDKVCVARCSSQDDCPSDLFFCEAISPGSIDGYCIPRSPAHCLPCGESSECGYFAEVCWLSPGDDENTCHVDCALAGQAACPADYSCQSVAIGNATRQLCVADEPKCQDALGGFCDNITTPQPCSRSSNEGTCTGERTCDPTSERFGACEAEVPRCKATCDDPDPAGCVLQACGNAANTIEHCGMCNNPCPGVGAANASPACIDALCSFSCMGESYDVDNDISNGCEKTDSPLGNHAIGAAVDVGSFPCTDGSSNRNISGSMHSDQRTHGNPPVPGFDAMSGSAPDWYQLYADGGFCQNEVVLTLNADGTGNLACYRLTVYTNNGTYSCDTNANGDCTVNENGTGAYSDNTNIQIEVRKTCPATSPGSVTYTVTGHL